MTSSSTDELVSVIIPCYNHARFLQEAIESVLRQSYQKIEIIVIDDGSTDNIIQVVAAYPNITYIRQDNQGVSRARNFGLLQSRGAYLIFLDADDRLLPEAVEIGVRTLTCHKDCALTFGLVMSIGNSSRIGQRFSPTHASTYQELLKTNFIPCPGSVLFNRWVFSYVGGFDEFNGPGADYDLYLRIARQLPIHCHHHPVVEYRKHGGNMSNDVAIMLVATLTALANQLEHVTGNPSLIEAYGKGRQYWLNHYGEPLINRMYRNLARGNIIQAGCDCYVLARFFPERLPIFIRRKLSKLYASLRQKFLS